MKRLSGPILLGALLIVIFSLPVYGATITCTACGMEVDLNSKFVAKIVRGDTTSYFCDIGDMFDYMKRKNLPSDGAQVKDYATGAWMDATKAFYVRAEKKFATPMSWGVAAFQDRNRAAE